MLLEEMVLQPYTYWQHKVDSVGLRKSGWRTREGTGEDRIEGGLDKNTSYACIKLSNKKAFPLAVLSDRDALFSSTVFPSPSKIFMTQMLDLFF